MTPRRRGRPHNYKPQNHDASGKRSGAYSSWAMMIQRCTNRKMKTWENYGGRGIKVCERWRTSFDNFLVDMGERPADRSLDRIDNDGNYEPGNCRWATDLEQVLNRRVTRRITFEGRTQNITAWADTLGLSIATLIYRIKKHGEHEAIRRGGPANYRDFRTENKTGLRGVGKRGSKYFAQIQYQGEVLYLGRFPTAEEAHQAYLQARAKFDAEAAA